VAFDLFGWRRQFLQLLILHCPDESFLDFWSGSGLLSFLSQISRAPTAAVTRRSVGLCCAPDWTRMRALGLINSGKFPLIQLHGI
jgi:hypothetical protein